MAHLFRHALCVLSARLQRYLPAREAVILGFVLVFALFWPVRVYVGPNVADTPDLNSPHDTED